MNIKEIAKKLGYSEGDPICGTRNKYLRSIYRVININVEGVHTAWESLNGMTSERFETQIIRLIPWERLYPDTEYYLDEGALDFRLASEEEVKKSREVCVPY